uniref:Putative secreted protein n=1 Tax=Anopheles darlingi TaxID=43151 RepID=A0A2M4DD37_ANODA
MEKTSTALAVTIFTVTISAATRWCISRPFSVEKRNQHQHQHQHHDAITVKSVPQSAGRVFCPHPGENDFVLIFGVGQQRSVIPFQLPLPCPRPSLSCVPQKEY